jgi:hypothetical protein
MPLQQDWNRVFQGKKNKKDLLQKSRRTYRKPHLQPYGSVKDLTAGGSGSKPENHINFKGQPAKKSRS